MKQKTLLGTKIDLESEEGLEVIKKEYCCLACQTAKNDDCNCRCKGLYHGIARKRKEEEKEEEVED